MKVVWLMDVEGVKDREEEKRRTRIAGGLRAKRRG